MTTEDRAFLAAWKICSAWDGKITKPVLKKAIEAALKEIEGSANIDAVAYRFWSIHPSELDEWEKTAPEMPHGYRGGVRAWFYACQMRAVFTEGGI
jgi:hypothetical protein